MSVVHIILMLLSLSLIASENTVLQKVGIAASPLTNPDYPENILNLAQRYKPDFIELKTTCATYRPPRDLPHIAHVINALSLTPSETIQTVVCTSDIPKNQHQPSLVNSVGLASSDPNHVQHKIKKTIELFQQNAIATNLIYSIYGSTMHEFIEMAHHAVSVQAPYVCINISCPNIGTLTPLYKDPNHVFTITSHIKKVIGSMPLIVKVGAFNENEDELMAAVVKAIAKSNAYALYGINSIPVCAIDTSGKPLFGRGREICGATGFQIQKAALTFIKKARTLITQHTYNLLLFACGGANTHSDFEAFFNAGADVVLSATGLIGNEHFTFPNTRQNYAKL